MVLKRIFVFAFGLAGAVTSSIWKYPTSLLLLFCAEGEPLDNGVWLLEPVVSKLLHV